MSRKSLHSVLRTQYLVVAVAMTIAGCAQTTAPPHAANSTAQTQLNLTRADSKALDELIAKHKGQVVLIDYWATWCGPCVENFPHTVALSRKYRDQGLAAIAVSFDLLEDEQKVRDF